jgi:hypothetical protein
MVDLLMRSYERSQGWQLRTHGARIITFLGVGLRTRHAAAAVAEGPAGQRSELAPSSYPSVSHIQPERIAGFPSQGPSPYENRTNQYIDALMQQGPEVIEPGLLWTMKTQ